jgi:hypothetical protein
MPDQLNMGLPADALAALLAADSLPAPDELSPYLTVEPVAALPHTHVLQ